MGGGLRGWGGCCSLEMLREVGMGMGGLRGTTSQHGLPLLQLLGEEKHPPPKKKKKTKKTKTQNPKKPKNKQKNTQNPRSLVLEFLKVLGTPPPEVPKGF